jgi:hypothetical protein
LRYIAVCCGMLRYVAVCCGILRYIAVCCGMLRYVAVFRQTRVMNGLNILPLHNVEFAEKSPNCPSSLILLSIYYQHHSSYQQLRQQNIYFNLPYFQPFHTHCLSAMKSESEKFSISSKVTIFYLFLTVKLMDDFSQSDT